MKLTDILAEAEAEDPSLLPAPPREPDMQWLRTTGECVQAFIVDQGRGYGFRVDWNIDGDWKTPLWYPMRIDALRKLDRWRKEETS